MRECIICKQNKSIYEFHGKTEYCKQCRLDFPEKIKHYRLDKRKLDHITNRERDNKRNKEYYISTDKKKKKEYYNANKDKFHEYFVKSYYLTDGYGIKASLKRCKWRSIKNNIPFDLDEEFLSSLLANQQYSCAITGIKFLSEKNDNYKMRPFSASIDRINTNLGYTKDNVRFVCTMVNFALNEFGEDNFRYICEQYMKFRNEI